MEADIFLTVGRKYFWSKFFKRAFKKLSEAHEFCPFSFRNSATLVSKVQQKMTFLTVWPIPLGHVPWIAYGSRKY